MSTQEQHHQTSSGASSEARKGKRKVCRCDLETDIDPEYINLPDYPPAKEKILKENINNFKSKFQELESAYHETCAELDKAKLELIPLNKKIKLMAGVLYTRQHVYNERLILDPDEFKKMLENSEPLLKGLNNKFINSIKAEVGLLLDASGAFLLAIETLAGAGLTVRHESIAKQKAR
ncbi:1493_t:CDS:2, partial [Gigaspora rosea]